MELTQVLFSKKLSGASAEEQLVYCYLLAQSYETSEACVDAERNAGRLTSTLSEQKLSQLTNLPVTTIRRCLSGLTKRRWIKLTQESEDKKYCLGKVTSEGSQITVELLLEIPAVNRKLGSEERLAKLRRQVQETKQRRQEAKEKKRPQLSAESKRQIAAALLPTSAVRKRGATGRLFNAICDSYYKTYKEPLEQVYAGNRTAALGMLGTLLKTVSENEAEAIAHACYCVEHWTKIQQALGGKQAPRPKINTLCSKKFYLVVKDFREKGIPTRQASNYSNIGQRYDAAKAEKGPDHGF